MKFSIVVAIAEDTFGIGFQGKLPWNIPADMKYFKQLTSITSNTTKQNVVIMGRKTWESIPTKFRPLNNRFNIVISSQMSLEAEQNTKVCRSLEEAVTFLNGAQNFEKVFLIGGASLYHQALRKNMVDEMYITQVKGNYEVDAFFPLVNLDDGKFSKIANDVAALNEIAKEAPQCNFEKYVLTEMMPLKSTEEFPEENNENVNTSNNPDAAAELKSIQKEIEKNKASHEEYQYLNLVLEVIMNGNQKMDRTQVGTRSVFGRTMRFSLANNTFPLLTTKNTFFRGVAEELLFFISGKTDNRLLQERGVHIWDLNCDRAFLDKLGMKEREEHDLGPVYGFQWRHFGADYTDFHADYSGKGVDQIQRLVHTLKTNPSDRRMILSAWNVKDLPKMVLPPCHMFAQFYVHDNKLSCQMYQRSADLGLGVPFNIASYALLTRMLAQVCGMEAYEFVHVIGDCHVYNNHIDQLLLQLQRKPREFPTLKLNPEKKGIDDFVFEDFELIGYKPHKRIKMQMAV